LRPYSPGGALIALAATRTGSIPPASSAHRLRRGLPGYLILFAPHAFAPQRQTEPSKPPSPPVFFRISTHSTATPGIPLASTRLQPPSIRGTLGVEPRHFTVRLKRPPARALRPVIPNNARTLCITAAAGTELAGASSGGTVKTGALPPPPVLPPRQRFTPRRASSRTRRRCVRLSPIAQDSPLLPPVGVWAVSQSQCGRSSSQIGYASSPW
jgi:hypothetical protein